jgi:hypothetical protein
MPQAPSIKVLDEETTWDESRYVLDDSIPPNVACMILYHRSRDTMRSLSFPEQTQNPKRGGKAIPAL